MMKLAVSVVDLDASSKGFAELHLGTGEAEAFWLGRDLETAAVPLHDVVIADDALVDEAADAAEIFGGRAPSLFRFSGSAAEAAVVVGQEAAQDIVGGDQIGGADEAEFTGKAVLKSAPQALDAALGLRAVGRNVGDAELRKSATKLGRLAFPRELFFDRPVVVVTHEDPVLVPIETEGDAVAAQQVAQQVEIPASIFRGEELSNGNLARGVVKEAEEGLPSRRSISPSRARQRRRWRCVGARRFLGEPRPFWRSRRRRVSRPSEQPSTSRSFSHR